MQNGGPQPSGLRSTGNAPRSVASWAGLPSPPPGPRRCACVSTRHVHSHNFYAPARPHVARAAICDPRHDMRWRYLRYSHTSHLRYSHTSQISQIQPHANASKGLRLSLYPLAQSQRSLRAHSFLNVACGAQLLSASCTARRTRVSTRPASLVHPHTRGREARHRHRLAPQLSLSPSHFA